MGRLANVFPKLAVEVEDGGRTLVRLSHRYPRFSGS